MNVLSLFDGISAGQVALERAGIKVDKYYASEIDKYAIQVTQKNYPDTVQIGDVTKVSYENGILEYENVTQDVGKIDLLIGGSPCQGFSFAGKQLNFEDDRSKLFFEYVRLLEETKPKYFLLENVKMKKEYQDVITKYLGVEPIEINSALVSAQTRKRLYWTNIPNIEQPKDKKIMLKDVIEGEGIKVDREKSFAIIASIGRTTPREYFYKNQGQMVFVDRDKAYCIDANYYKGANWQQYISKARRQLVIEFINNNYLVRKLTPIECERLQTLPDNYTEGISNTQRYKCLGNSFTVDVIAHIFKRIE
jgi:site-specific DNA-cytosine methylase